MGGMLGQCFAQVLLLRSETLTVVIQDIRADATQVEFTLRVRTRTPTAVAGSTITVTCADVAETVPLAPATSGSERLRLPPPPERRPALQPLRVATFDTGSDLTYSFSPRPSGQSVTFRLLVGDPGHVRVGVLDGGVLDAAAARSIG